MDTKLCTKCNMSKPVSEFSFKNKKRNIRNSHCKQCHSLYVQEHYKRNKQAYKDRAKRDYALEMQRVQTLLAELKGDAGCAHCGINHPAVLEFHHADPSVKEGEVAALAYINRQRAREEAQKCVVLCSNCHKIEHWRLRQQPAHLSQSGRGAELKPQ